jgi:hypothetical protein
MMHITYAEKSLLVGDIVADLVLEYGAKLADQGRADTVTLHAIGADGDEVVAKLLLDSGSNLMAESTNATYGEPDNAGTESYIREQMSLLSSPRTALPADDGPLFNMDEIQMDVPGA